MKKAFTIVELAIVFVIIGLLVAAITAGRSLIDQSKLQRFMNEVQSLDSAIIAFEQIYEYLPGDFIEAADYWSGETDGDGNGDVENVGNNETANVITHLQAAELALNFQQVISYASSDVYKSSLFVLENKASFPCSGSIGVNAIQFVGDGNWSAAMSQKAVYSIDKKIDDALPSSGEVRAQTAGLSPASLSGDVYAATSSTKIVFCYGRY